MMRDGLTSTGVIESPIYGERRDLLICEAQWRLWHERFWPSPDLYPAEHFNS